MRGSLRGAPIRPIITNGFAIFLSQWPVGLKNVGQTCWFSAVIQSLFYLPAFRTLVLNYEPPSQQEKFKDEGMATFSSSYKVDRQRKIVEFMQELRNLFALMVATQRKYVDPTRAVDILRGSIGNNNQMNNGNNTAGKLIVVGPPGEVGRI